MIENTSGIVIDCNKIKSGEKTREPEIDDALNAVCNWLQDVKEGRAKKSGFRLRQVVGRGLSFETKANLL